jgi:hypothetical protein
MLCCRLCKLNLSENPVDAGGGDHSGGGDYSGVKAFLKVLEELDDAAVMQDLELVLDSQHLSQVQTELNRTSNRFEARQTDYQKEHKVPAPYFSTPQAEHGDTEKFFAEELPPAAGALDMF